MTKRFVFAFLMLGAALQLAGCASTGNHVTGFIYAEVKQPEMTTNEAGATRVGKACANSILGMVATGDYSLEAAKKAGGITRVSSVDTHHDNILGIYATVCTIVRGN